MAVLDRFRQWWRGRPVSPIETVAVPGRLRGQVDHVILLDGTFSTLDPGEETNVGQIFQLLSEAGQRAHLRLYYEPGSQWEGWRHGWDIIQGKGLDSQIMRAYGWLASHYREGDRIFLIGYSRGAYAVRSLSGLIDRVGLLRQEEATERAVGYAFRHYRANPDSDTARAFAFAYCHHEAPIEMVGVFDTVKSMGLHLPLLWMFFTDKTAFHNPHLGGSIRHGFQALALNETRHAFAPVLWECPPGWEGNIEQVWFRGAHGDVGGQTGTMRAARPLANVALVWMLERAETVGLPLPEGWRDRFPQDVNAPMVGTWRSWGKYFLFRSRRKVGRDTSEQLHPSLAAVAPRKRFFP
ncbi:MAG: DUF2235 domain-containing protein [Cypionkella sp.]